MTTFYSPAADISDTPPSRRIRFAAISEAWDFVKAERTTWTLIALIILTTSLVLFFAVRKLLLIFGISTTSKSHVPFSWVPDLTPMHITGTILSYLIKEPINAFLGAGLYRTAFKQIRGEKIQVSDLFRPGGLVAPFIVTSLLLFLIVSGCGIYLYFPGLLLSGVFYLTYSIVADRRAGPVEAMQMSFAALKDQIFTSFVFVIAVNLVSALGMLACGIGAIFTFPIAFLVPIIVYRDFFGLEPVQEPLRQIQMPLPPQYPAAAPIQDNEAA